VVGIILPWQAEGRRDLSARDFTGPPLASCRFPCACPSAFTETGAGQRVLFTLKPVDGRTGRDPVEHTHRAERKENYGIGRVGVQPILRRMPFEVL